MLSRSLLAVAIVVIVVCPGAFGQDNRGSNQARTSNQPPAPQLYQSEGISVEFNVTAASAKRRNSAELLAGEDAVVRFRISEINGGRPLNSLRPAAWIDQRESTQATQGRECREKIQSLLQPSFGKRPAVDLNSYLILALNSEANISVIDPLSGFGGSKLFTLVALQSPGEDWVMSPDRKRLYVSMPDVNQIAVVDLRSWKVIANIEGGVKPTRLALQHDGRYLWIGNEGTGHTESGVTVVDTVLMKVAATLRTGLGHHEIALTDDDRKAFVTNKRDGTLSVIDVRKLSEIARVNVGAQPSSVVFSSLSKAAYVVAEGDGMIVAVDGSHFGIVAHIKAERGLNTIRIAPEHRFGFAINPTKNTLYVFDLASNRIVHAVPVGPGADQISFSKQFAYIRSTGSEFVTMLKLAGLEKEAAISRFPAGQKAPRESRGTSQADAIVAAPETGSVLVANPADKMIYYYSEGMAAPMGSFQNYRRDPKSLLVLDNGLRETAPGVYTIDVRLSVPGQYDVPFLLNSPRIVNCFTLTVIDNPALPNPKEIAIKIEPVAALGAARVGERYRLRFRVTDSTSNKPKTDLKDLGVLVFLAPGIWQHREWATAVGDGVYEISFVPPQSGVYYVYFQSPSLGLRFSQLSPLTLEAVKT